MIIEAAILCIILVVVISSELAMWNHIKDIRCKIDRMFEGKSPEDIYNFINKKADVDESDDCIEDINEGEK